jgi:hypothetical protein
MDVDLAKLGNEVNLGERPPPATSVDPGKYLLINWLHQSIGQLFSGKWHCFAERSTAWDWVP